MSPRSPQYPNPASGDDADASGRHRRPESLADVVRPRPPAAFRLGNFEEGFIEYGFDERPDEARPRQSQAQEAQPRATRRRAARRRGAQPGRHSAALRKSAPEPPVTGTHRAPGTLPLETLLRIGKGRQQVLLASLIVLGLLVVAVPAQQRRDGVQAVNAAAQRVIGSQPTQKQPRTTTAKPVGSKGKPAAGRSTEAVPAATNSPAPPATPAKQATTKPVLRAEGLGPGRSVRTTGSAAIALTFDDGPDPVQTPKILALLDEYQLKATFCLVGHQVEKHPEIVRQIAAAGHTLCNHTWDHSLTIGKDEPAKIQEDLARTNAAIRAAVPNAQIPFFRAPGGNFTERLVEVADTDAMTSLYWEVDPRDWEHATGEDARKHVDRVIASVRKQVRPGSIVLSHDFNQPDTILAYESLLPWLKQNFRIGLPATPTPTPSATVPSEAPTTPAPSAPAEPEPIAPTTPATSAPALAAAATSAGSPTPAP
ncbi:polysaccharide deacetylase family protein [Micromonosporaceae bacterium Da 78-11]